MKRLHEGVIQSITAVDGSASYNGWVDLIATLRELILNERGQATSVWINLPDADPAHNIIDHSDHRQTGQAVLEAIDDLSCVNKVLYLDYEAARLEENLNTPDREVKTATFAAVAIGMNAFGYPSNWDPQHRALLGRAYSRTVPGTANC